MRHAIRVICSLVLTGFIAAGGAAAQEPRQCGPLGYAIAQLAEQYGEAPIAIAEISNGRQIITLATESGSTFTQILVSGGQACLIGSGERWTAITWEAPKPRGPEL